MRVLISGVGIAGPTLAYWLLQHGMEPTLVEKAPRLRTAGYVVDFWGSGFDVAERMGLLPEVKRLGYRVREVRMVGRDGRRVGGFSSEVFSRATADRFVSLPRGELASLIYGSLDGRVETLFGDSVTALEEDTRGVHVLFQHAPARTFDLVIGADGLHSEVRRLVFGPEPGVERYLGYHVAAFEVEGYPRRDPDVYVMYTEVGRQLARFTMRDDRSLFLFMFEQPDPHAGGETDAERKTLLRREFGGGGWECPAILEAMDRAGSLYYDRVSQIRMRQWSKGRVGLLGDAASCPSLLAGQGSALAMLAAYVLAGELKNASANPDEAFVRYQERLGPLIARKQAAAARFGGFFVPSTRLGLFLRNQLSRLVGLPVVGRFIVDRALSDELPLPEY